MLFVRYIKWFALFFTTLLVSEQIPLIKTIDPGPSGPSQLLSAVGELANEAKDNIVEMAIRSSDFFHENESNQSPPVFVFLPPLPEPPPQSSQSPEPMSLANSTSHFWRLDGSKVILELDLERMPGFDATRKVVAWVAHWFAVLSSVGSRVDWVEQPYWLHILVPAALGFFGGLGYGFAGWCRWYLSRRKVPQKTVEKVERVKIAKQTQRRTPANVFFESRLSQSYMMPLNFQHVPDPRLLRVSAPIAATKLEQAEDTSIMIVKKEEDADPLMIPSSLDDSSWYSPGSTLSPTQLNDRGMDLSSYDGFQPKPKVSDPNGLPDTLLGSFPPIVSPPRPRKPSLPQISDPWSNYIPDDQAQLS